MPMVPKRRPNSQIASSGAHKLREAADLSLAAFLLSAVLPRWCPKPFAGCCVASAVAELVTIEGLDVPTSLVLVATFGGASGSGDPEP